jgi:CHASE3 domain sensor protein
MANSSSQVIRKASGWLALTVLTTLLFGVLALWLTDRANTQQVGEFNRILQVADATRLAQVHFKTQVQEWKNVLLRGQNEADYQRYLGQFHTEAAHTVDELNQAVAQKKALGLDASDVAAALTEHRALMDQYDRVLRDYQRGNAASVFAVDTAIRGRDRHLNEMIDAVAEAMRADADRRTQAFAQENGRRYQTLRAIMVTLSVVTLALVGWLVVLTLRSREQAAAA